MINLCDRYFSIGKSGAEGKEAGDNFLISIAYRFPNVLRGGAGDVFLIFKTILDVPFFLQVCTCFGPRV